MVTREISRRCQTARPRARPSRSRPPARADARPRHASAARIRRWRRLARRGSDPHRARPQAAAAQALRSWSRSPSSLTPPADPLKRSRGRGDRSGASASRRSQPAGCRRQRTAVGRDDEAEWRAAGSRGPRGGRAGRLAPGAQIAGPSFPSRRPASLVFTVDRSRSALSARSAGARRTASSPQPALALGVI